MKLLIALWLSASVAQARGVRVFIEDDEGKETVLPISREEFSLSIGREVGNAVRLTERDVSQHHALLECDAHGCTIKDLFSENGIYVNGKRVGSQQAVGDGDRVQIAGYALYVARAKKPPKRAPRLMVGAKSYPVGAVVTIGSAADNTVAIAGLAAHHARIVQTGRRVRLFDLGGGLRLSGEDYGHLDLIAGDEFDLGRVRLRFEP